jgi:hypothetical protein
MDASRGGEIEEMINQISDGTEEADMTTLLSV